MPRNLNLSRSYRTNYVEFRDLLKYYKNSTELKAVDLNFCYNLGWTTRLSRMIPYDSLKSLRVLSVKIKLCDLLELVNSLALQELAFTLVDDNSINTKGKTTFEGLQAIQMITIELKCHMNQIFVNLMNNFVNVQRLELFSSNKFHFKLNLQQFTHKFIKLEELLTHGCVHIGLEAAYSYLTKLKLFSFTINLNHLNLDIIENIKSIKNKHLLKHFDYAISHEPENMSPVNGLIEINNKLSDLCDLNFLKSLESFKLRKAINFGCLLTNIAPLKLQFDLNCNLTTLDLKEIHIHSTESICKLIAQLNCKFFHKIEILKSSNFFHKSFTKFVFTNMLSGMRRV